MLEHQRLDTSVFALLTLVYRTVFPWDWGLHLDGTFPQPIITNLHSIVLFTVVLSSVLVARLREFSDSEIWRKLLILIMYFQVWSERACAIKHCIWCLLFPCCWTPTLRWILSSLSIKTILHQADEWCTLPLNSIQHPVVINWIWHPSPSEKSRSDVSMYWRKESVPYSRVDPRRAEWALRHGSRTRREDSTPQTA